MLRLAVKDREVCYTVFAEMNWFVATSPCGSYKNLGFDNHGFIQEPLKASQV